MRRVIFLLVKLPLLLLKTSFQQRKQGEIFKRGREREKHIQIEFSTEKWLHFLFSQRTLTTRCVYLDLESFVLNGGYSLKKSQSQSLNSEHLVLKIIFFKSLKKRKILFVFIANIIVKIPSFLLVFKVTFGNLLYLVQGIKHENLPLTHVKTLERGNSTRCSNTTEKL